MGIRSKADRWSLSAANAARLVFPTSSISPNAYWSFIGENRARASDRVIHPRSPTGKALSDADNATSSTALSLRASGGTDMPGAKAALMAFHIPMTERFGCRCGSDRCRKHSISGFRPIKNARPGPRGRNRRCAAQGKVYAQASGLQLGELNGSRKTMDLLRPVRCGHREHRCRRRCQCQ
jgi:hypothetical protein